MKTLSAFQLLGPMALFAALAAAEAASCALQFAPQSEWLWYVNLNWFSLFQRSHYCLQAVTGGDLGQFSCVAAPLAALAAVGVIFKRSLLLALSSNLSFVYIAFLATVWGDFKGPPQASLLGAFPVSLEPNMFVLSLLIGLSLVSFSVSHIAYVMKLRAESA